MENIKIGIVGLGLIGGSIFKALKALNYDVLGVSKSQKGENISKNLTDLKECDVVFVCSEMSKTVAVLDELQNIVKEKTIVTDVCSIKNFLKDKKYFYNFVSSHPMAGTEFSGFENSFKELFDGAKWVIFKRNKVLEDIIKKMGATPVLTNFEEHDRATALISHAPLLLSFALFNAIKDDNLAKKLASSGFYSMTRLAQTNSKLALDMLELNSRNIDEAIEKIEKSIEIIKEMPAEKKVKLFEKIANERRKMYKNGKNQK